MYPAHHAASAVVAGAALRGAGWSWGAISAFAAGAVLLDVDHYVMAVWRTGDLSLTRAYREHPRRSTRVRRPGFRVHFPFWGGYNRPLHSVPVLAGLALGAWRAPALRPLAAGVVLHRVLDVAWESRPRR